MPFDIRAIFNGSADSRDSAHEVARVLSQTLAGLGLTGIVEVREHGTSEPFIRDVVSPEAGAAPGRGRR